jgi:hypothetical protein
MDRAVSGVADREFPQRRRKFQNRYERSLHPFRAFPKVQRGRQIHIISNIRKHGRAMAEGSKTPLELSPSSVSSVGWC